MVARTWAISLIAPRCSCSPRSLRDIAPDFFLRVERREKFRRVAQLLERDAQAVQIAFLAAPGFAAALAARACWRSSSRAATRVSLVSCAIGRREWASAATSSGSMAKSAPVTQSPPASRLCRASLPCGHAGGEGFAVAFLWLARPEVWVRKTSRSRAGPRRLDRILARLRRSPSHSCWNSSPKDFEHDFQPPQARRAIDASLPPNGPRARSRHWPSSAPGNPTEWRGRRLPGACRDGCGRGAP